MCSAFIKKLDKVMHGRGEILILVIDEVNSILRFEIGKMDLGQTPLFQIMTNHLFRQQCDTKSTANSCQNGFLGDAFPDGRHHLACLGQQVLKNLISAAASLPQKKRLLDQLQQRNRLSGQWKRRSADYNMPLLE